MYNIYMYYIYIQRPTMIVGFIKSHSFFFVLFQKACPLEKDNNSIHRVNSFSLGTPESPGI
jgi:hypothetical protein